MPALVVSALVWLFLMYVVFPIFEVIAAFWPFILGGIGVFLAVVIFKAIRHDSTPSSQSLGKAYTNHFDKVPAILREPERSRNSDNWRNSITSYDTDRIIGRYTNPPAVREQICNPGLDGGLSKEAAATIVSLTRSASYARHKNAPLGGVNPSTLSKRKRMDSQRLAPTNSSELHVPPGVPTHGLVILEEHLNKILHGRKTMELRSMHNRQLGMIALIKKGSGKIYGVAEIVESIGPMSFNEFCDSAHEHAIAPEMLREIFEKGWNHGWRLRNVVTIKSPVSYIHRRGAVIKVKLDPAAIDALGKQLNRV